MSNTLKITLIQTDLVWENPGANRKQLEDKITPLQSTQLIVLPEMFTSGFTMNAEAVSETMEGTTVKWMAHMAQKKNSAITGSLVVEDGPDYYNRMVFVHPNGTIESYDKRHTFTLAGEHKVYKPGTHKVIIDFLGWKICPMICYDLRFPVWARNTEDYDILLYVANWPKPRISAWDALLKARAIENMSYSVGVNRIGIDGTGHQYSGHSSVYDVLGHQLVTITENSEAIKTIQLEKNTITHYRNKLGFLNDKDDFKLL